MYFSSLIRTKILLPWEAPVQWYLICIIRFMSFICVLKDNLWAPSYLMLYTAWMLLSERQHFSCVNIYFYLWICIIILYLVLSACVSGTYICAYVSVCACVLPTYVCTHIHELCTCICLMLSHAGAVFVCACVCVRSSEMECVLFYSRKIAHRANVICCIMYPTLNKSYLILSNLILSHLISSYLILC